MPVWRLHTVGWQHIVQGPQRVGESLGCLRLLRAQQDTCTPKGNLDALYAAAPEAWPGKKGPSGAKCCSIPPALPGWRGKVATLEPRLWSNMRGAGLHSGALLLSGVEWHHHNQNLWRSP